MVQTVGHIYLNLQVKTGLLLHWRVKDFVHVFLWEKVW